MASLINQFVSWSENIPFSDKALLILAFLVLVINLAFGVIHLLKAEIKSYTEEYDPITRRPAGPRDGIPLFQNIRVDHTEIGFTWYGVACFFFTIGSSILFWAWFVRRDQNSGLAWLIMVGSTLTFWWIIKQMLFGGKGSPH